MPIPLKGINEFWKKVMKTDGREALLLDYCMVAQVEIRF